MKKLLVLIFFLLSVYSSYSQTEALSKGNYANSNCVARGSYIVTTSEELRTLADITAKNVYQTAGEAGGIWYFDQKDSISKDNSATVLVNGKKRLKRLYTGPVNIKWFGVNGDGTNQTAAIKKALNALSEMGGGKLYFPKGVYVSDKMWLPPRVNIIGDGLEVTILKLTPNSTANAFIDLTNSYEGSISDVTIDGNKAANNNADGILLTADSTNGGNSNYRYEISRTYIKNCKGNGISAYYPSWIFAVKDCSIRDNDGYGIYNESTDNGFYNNIISLNAKGGIYNKGSNTRFIGGKILFNGKGVAGSAGIFDASARSQYTGIECQENYYNGFVLDGSRNVSAVNIVSDMNNVARRPTKNHGLAIEDAIGYGFLFKNAADCYVQGMATSAIRERVMTQSAYYVSNTCYRNSFSITEGMQLKEGVNAARDNNQFIVEKLQNSQANVTDSAFSSQADKTTDRFTLHTILSNKTLTLPATTSVFSRIVIFNQNKNSSFFWKTNLPVKSGSGENITRLKNNTVYVLEPFGEDWYVVSAYTE